jgi:hypothetical protein
MNHAKLILAAALVGLSFTSMAGTDSTREQRMNEALENHRSASAAPKSAEPGRLARAEESAKRGARKAGHAIKRGAQRAGQGIGAGVEKTGEALRRTGEKIKESSEPAK